MPKGEQAEIQKSLLWDYQQKKTELLCLKAKASGLAEKLRDLADILSATPEYESDPRNNKNLVPEIPHSDSLGAMIHEIWEIRNGLRSMRATLTGMGVSFPID